ncbi:MAG: 1,4-dihydroxy-2-naphthoyl-CoA hydrolase [Thermoleophilaceae bacterium]|nr:1,4-dihydroxy-2-naphthoyl-CoA hydrolase [Thermoleophilaceae bacterium]
MSAEPLTPPESFEGTLDATLGFETLEVNEDSAKARFAVVQKVKQPFGLVHGGAFAAISESLCSGATFAAVHGDGLAAMGMSNLTTFLRPVFHGTVHASARRLHRGRTTWVWEVDLTDDQDRLCAVSRVTIAVRPMPDGTPG